MNEIIIKEPMTEWKEYKLKTVVEPVETTDRIHDRELFMKGIDYSYYYEEEGEGKI